MAIGVSVADDFRSLCLIELRGRCVRTFAMVPASAKVDLGVFARPRGDSHSIDNPPARGIAAGAAAVGRHASL